MTHDLPRAVLTSGVKRVDIGVLQATKQVKAGAVNGDHDLVFNLKNGGMGVGKINPAVPKSDTAVMNSYKAMIIAGELEVPTTL